MRFETIELCLPSHNQRFDGVVYILIPATAPLLLWDPENSHRAQFGMLSNLDTFRLDYDALKSLATIAKVEYTFHSGFEEMASILAKLVDIPHLKINLGVIEKCRINLPVLPFSAHIVEVDDITGVPGGLYWLSSCFPSLEKIVLRFDYESPGAFDGAFLFKHLTTFEALRDFSLPFWRRLVAASPKLVKILLHPNSMMIEYLSREFPEILVGKIVPIQYF